jgi:hypothetical protein
MKTTHPGTTTSHFMLRISGCIICNGDMFLYKKERDCMCVCVCVFLHSVDLKPWQLTHMFWGRLPVQSVQSVDNTLKWCKSPQPKVTPRPLPIPPSWRNTQNKSNELVTIFKLVQALCIIRNKWKKRQDISPLFTLICFIFNCIHPSWLHFMSFQGSYY